MRRRGNKKTPPQVPRLVEEPKIWKTVYCRGSWRIWTAVHGFADRCLTTRPTNHCFRDYACKDTTIFGQTKCFGYFIYKLDVIASDGLIWIFVEKMLNSSVDILDYPARDEQIPRNFGFFLPKFHFILPNFYFPVPWRIVVSQWAICKFLRRNGCDREKVGRLVGGVRFW